MRDDKTLLASIPMFVLRRVWGDDTTLWPTKADDPRVGEAMRANDKFHKELNRA